MTYFRYIKKVSITVTETDNLFQSMEDCLYLLCGHKNINYNIQTCEIEPLTLRG